MGLVPHAPSVRYYFSRNPRSVNRIVDISSYIDKKVEINMLNVTQGPAGQNGGKQLWKKLADEGKSLDILGDENSANHNFIKHFLFDIDAERMNFHQMSNRKLGQRYGLEWAEWYHYISDLEDQTPDLSEKYIAKNAKLISRP